MLHLTAADRAQPLAAALAEMLASPLPDPMQAEWVAVPTGGMRRWLQLELARSLGATGPATGDGISANIDFHYPGALRQVVLTAGRAAREDGTAGDDTDPWQVHHLVWAVLEVLHTGRSDERLGPLTTLPPGATWFGRARRLADLFDRYSMHRPELIRAWQAGRDVDAAGEALPPHDLWQPHLWRLTRACIGEPSPPERLPELLDDLRTGSLVPDLPPRLAVFGVTTLPGGAPFLELAEAAAAHRDLHVFLLDPSPAGISRVRDHALAAPGGAALLRSDDRSDDTMRHPLLRSWGRPYRERTVLLADAEARGLPAPRRVTSEQPGGPGARETLLARVQHDLRTDTVPAGDFELDPDDRSIQVHSCHGPARQVEVLRDAILHLLADDPTLRQDEIVVLSPSIEDFAPWVEAGFGTSADRAARHSPGWPRLTYQIADRSLRQSAPLVAALGTLLELVAGRFSASAVLELLATAPVRERFGFDDDAIAVVVHWVTETQVRWGLDGAHRESWGVPAMYTANSWRAALDRLLMGVAVSENGLALAPGEIAPLGVEGNDITVVGRLADVLAHLAAIADDMSGSRPAAAWCETLLDACDRLFAVEPSQQWQLDRLRRIVADIADDSRLRGRASPVALTLADIRRLLADRMDGAPRSTDYFRGGITFSSLTPLRWLPFRVVCVLGLDERGMGTGAFDGDDLAERAPRLGDRDARAEQRQALLEAVLAAGDHLVITRTGHNILTNQDVPEAVALAELRDTITATLAGPLPRRAYASQIEAVHPHQPFDDRCFRPGALRPGPWSFDTTALAGAQARAEQRTDAVPFLAAPLAPPADDGAVITLAALQSFLKHPVKFFFSQRLRLHLPGADEGISDHLPTSLGGLDEWSVAHRLIDARLDGHTTDEWMRHERALGTLPAGGFGDSRLAEVADLVEALLATAAALGVEPRQEDPHPIDVALDDGTRVVGTVDRRCCSDLPGPARLIYSKAQPKHHLEAWLDLMALVAEDPEQPWRSVVVRRAENGNKPDPLELVARAITPDERRADARAALAVVVDCFRRGRREPIPLFAKLSRKLYGDNAKPGDWLSRSWGEGTEDAHILAFGAVDLRELRAVPARPDDPPGARPGRADRFAEYVWSTVERSATVRVRDDQSETADVDAEPAIAPAPR